MPQKSLLSTKTFVVSRNYSYVEMRCYIAGYQQLIGVIDSHAEAAAIAATLTAVSPEPIEFFQSLGTNRCGCFWSIRVSAKDNQKFRFIADGVIDALKKLGFKQSRETF